MTSHPISWLLLRWLFIAVHVCCDKGWITQSRPLDGSQEAEKELMMISVSLPSAPTSRVRPPGSSPASCGVTEHKQAHQHTLKITNMFRCLWDGGRSINHINKLTGFMKGEKCAWSFTEPGSVAYDCGVQTNKLRACGQAGTCACVWASGGKMLGIAWTVQMSAVVGNIWDYLQEGEQN